MSEQDKTLMIFTDCSDCIPAGRLVFAVLDMLRPAVLLALTGQLMVCTLLRSHFGIARDRLNPHGVLFYSKKVAVTEVTSV